MEVFGVAEADDGGAVVGDDVGGVVGHAPAFAGVGEGGELAEGGAVVDPADVGLPGPLVEVGAPVDDAFAEVLRGDVDVLEDAAGGGVFDEELRLAFEAGAFVEAAVEVEEAFGVEGGRVGEGGYDRVAVDGGGGLGFCAVQVRVSRKAVARRRARRMMLRIPQGGRSPRVSGGFGVGGGR